MEVDFEQLWNLFLDENKTGEDPVGNPIHPVNFLGSAVKYKENFMKAVQKYKEQNDVC